MLRRLYQWVIDLAERRSAPWALAAVSFAESSFFPVPPDVMLVPMCLARPARAWWYATICTLASVVGGLAGYAIGALLYESLGLFLIQLYGYGARVDAFTEAYQRYGHWIILIKGLTPIPYKVVTITSGFAHYSLFWFVVLSVITRGLRFFMVAGLLYWIGPSARTFIEERLGLVTAAFAVLVVGGVLAAVYLF
ncbi:YqaA family protein [Ancylobacter vacuolatus]|uniref:Membrane protein YqaA with SNARE-associated domain n=1 Tax=Ancylobacter vacuolatus TaxID=223389 RepID=A0ABU0DKC3_9HYPH|nr:YqaA family protein [Ancylobacter vacuolatus]MDQ0348877.1 membrane protein YqaA with SNARE-associated domain [Ancylobacter vacuolatus]